MAKLPFHNFFFDQLRDKTFIAVKAE